MTEAEYHVASFVVYARPGEGAQAASRLAEQDGIEVHAEDGGRIVVTAEADNVRRLAEMAASLEDHDCVVSVAPVYHEFSSDGEAALPVSREQNTNQE